MNKIYYFAFGSNINTERLKERSVNFVDIKSGFIKGYKLAFDKKALGKQGQTYANIQKSENSIVEGILYEVSEQCIKNLDKFEGVPNHYIRKEIDVFTKNEIVKAWVYIANEKMLSEGKPSKEYLSHLLSGKEWLSESYYKGLCAVETLR